MLSQYTVKTNKSLAGLRKVTAGTSEGLLSNVYLCLSHW